MGYLGYINTASHHSPLYSLGSGGDPTIHQQRLGLAGEALAAKWLSGLARSPALLSTLLGVDMGGPSTGAVSSNSISTIGSGGSDHTGNWIVEWNNESTESGLPYDIILHCSAFGRTVYIEVKTTTTMTNASIDVSINHLDFARAHPNNYLILRVFVEEIEATATSASSPFVVGDNTHHDGTIPSMPHSISSVGYRARRIVVINSVWEAIRTKAIQILLRF